MSQLEHVMERVGRMVAADQMLEVIVRGTQAYALPGRVVIPAIDQYEWLGKHAQTLLFGVLFHECGHASFTDFALLDETLKSDKRKGAAFKDLWNVIEDAFVEREKGAQFKGCARRFGQLYGWSWDCGLDGEWGKREVLRTGCDKTGKPMQGLSLFFTALNALGRPYGSHTMQELEALNPAIASMMRPFEAEIEKAKRCDSTEACLALTREIYDRLADENEMHGYKPEKSDTGEEREEGQAEADESAGGSGGEPGDEAEEDGGAEPRPGAFNLDRYTEEPNEPLFPSQALEWRVGKLFEQPDHVAPYMVFSHEFDLVRDFSTDVDLDGVGWEEAQRDSREAAAALTNAFEVSLRATAETRAVGGFDEGVPDPEMLAQYMLGACPADRLFMQYQKGDGDDVAVGVLVDCSGSMYALTEGSKSWLARQTAIAIHDALEPCQIAHEITGFTTLTSNHGARPWTNNVRFAEEVEANFDRMREALMEAEKRGTDLTKFARALFYNSANAAGATLQVPVYGVFKNFDQSDARGLMHVTGINHNLDGEAVLWQGRRLAARPEKRRVMFVLSDGHPAGSRDNAQGAAYLKEAVERCIDAGIEVYGFGIQDDHVQRFYPEWWKCNRLEDLTHLAVTHLCEVLLRNKQEHEWVEAI